MVDEMKNGIRARVNQLMCEAIRRREPCWQLRAVMRGMDRRAIQLYWRFGR